jgi:hypothetical protein
VLRREKGAFGPDDRLKLAHGLRLKLAGAVRESQKRFHGNFGQKSQPTRTVHIYRPSRCSQITYSPAFPGLACSPLISQQFTSGALLTPADGAIVCGMLKPWTAAVDEGSLPRGRYARIPNASRKRVAILHSMGAHGLIWASSRTLEPIDGWQES